MNRIYFVKSPLSDKENVRKKTLGGNPKCFVLFCRILPLTRAVFYWIYKSIQSKIPPVSKSFQYIVFPSMRIYEWGVSSFGKETEPQLA